MELTKPALAPASIAMLQMDILASIDIAAILSPVSILNKLFLSLSKSHEANTSEFDHMSGSTCCSNHTNYM